MKPPFDELPKVTELIRLRKEKTVMELAEYFKCSYDRIEDALKYWGIRKNMSSPKRKNMSSSKGKYDYLIDEPVNKGHDYSEIVKKQNVKITKEWFGTMRKKPAEYYRKYRKDHLERRREIEKRWREKNAEYLKEYRKKHHKK